MYTSLLSKQMLARPEVHSQQDNFAGSMTMVFASGSARALFDEDATTCAPSVLSANRKLVARQRGKSLENGIVGKFDSKKSMTRKASQTDMALMKNAGTPADKTACFRVMSVCHAFPSCFSGPIFVRFIWQRVDANHTRLEQAYSDDGGKKWETNWIYEGERQSK